VLYELPLRYKGSRYRDEKRRIAQVAIERVGKGFVIGLTGGTTTTEVARALIDRPGLTVVTNALNIASELAVRPNLKLVVTGGQARSQSYELIGPLAEPTLAGLNLDIAFLGVDGISAGAGLTTHNEVEAKTNRLLLKRARNVIVVADSSKVGRVAFAQICRTKEADELITDSGADESLVAELMVEGLSVTVV
jgi:DeoR family transcriptional regulator of aga operon